MGKSGNRRYNPEFKQQAAELANRIGTSQAARHLGIPVQNVHTWKKNANKNETKPANVKSDLESEIRQLRKENDELNKVNQILKRAAAFFSQDHLK